MKEWLSKMDASDWIAGYAAIVATGVLILEVWKYFTGGPKLKLMLEPQERHESILDFTNISITNSGSSSITVVEIRLVVRNDGKKYKQKGALGYNKNLPVTLSSSEQMVVNMLTEHITTPGYWIEVYCSHRAQPYTMRLPDPKGERF